MTQKIMRIRVGQILTICIIHILHQTNRLYQFIWGVSPKILSRNSDRMQGHITLGHRVTSYAARDSKAI